MGTCRSTDKKPYDNKLKLEDIVDTCNSATAILHKLNGGAFMETTNKVNATAAAIEQACRPINVTKEFTFDISKGESLPL